MLSVADVLVAVVFEEVEVAEPVSEPVCELELSELEVSELEIVELASEAELSSRLKTYLWRWRWP